MSEPERQRMDVDIVRQGFGPATAGFLTTLSSTWRIPTEALAIESHVQPGLPLQVLCYERADDISFGVSGVVTRAARHPRHLAPSQPGRTSHGHP